MAADSRVSFVSFLKAKPSIAIFLSATVLKSSFTIRPEKRLFCESFIATTLFQ